MRFRLAKPWFFTLGSVSLATARRTDSYAAPLSVARWAQVRALRGSLEYTQRVQVQVKDWPSGTRCSGTSAAASCGARRYRRRTLATYVLPAPPGKVRSSLGARSDLGFWPRTRPVARSMDGAAAAGAAAGAAGALDAAAAGFAAALDSDAVEAEA